MHRRLLAAFALVLVISAALSPSRAARADDWCWGDPIVLIGGKVVSIDIGVQGSWTQVANHVSNAHTRIYVPQGVSTSVLGYTPAPFTESVEFIPVAWLSNGANDIDIKVEVSFTRKTGESRDAQVDMTQDGYRTYGFRGETDEVINAKFRVRK
jgi:hypothetical protein